MALRPIPDLAPLQAELELLVMDVVAGGPNTDKLRKSVRRVVDARLRREIGPWLKSYEVAVGADRTGEGIVVSIQLQGRDAVETLRIGTRLI